MHRLDEKRTVKTIRAMKKRGEKIASVTAYDYPSACVASDAGIDMILVGDSLGMVVQGHENTLRVTVEQMIYHTRMVADAEPLSLVVVDMPFGSYHTSVESSVENAVRFVKEGGAEAVKLEGGKRRFPMIEAILDAEIPVLGHLGLTPQSVLRLGGFKTQGRPRGKAEEIVADAVELEKLGVFGIVLESIPAELGKLVSQSVSIPTIGIGAGKHCDGQILVFHDLMGITNTYIPKFARKYANLYPTMLDALGNYKQDIIDGAFPSDAESVLSKKNGKKDEIGNNAE